MPKRTRVPPPTLPPRTALELAVGLPFADWSHQCHAISIALVKARLWPVARVARGWCDGVPAQHSWVVLGNDVYARDVYIVDPTLWSYDPTVLDVWVGLNKLKRHRPHDAGSIWGHGHPNHAAPDRAYRLNRTGLSLYACHFLDLVEPLDVFGWGKLVSGPVEGWPAREIVATMHQDPRLSVHVPIDIVGMLTDANPGGLYLPENPIGAQIPQELA